MLEEEPGIWIREWPVYRLNFHRLSGLDTTKPNALVAACCFFWFIRQSAALVEFTP